MWESVSSMKRLVQLREKSDEQLKNRLNEIELSFRRTKGKSSASRDTASKSSQGENTMYLGNLRKQRARILTILNERKHKSKEDNHVKKEEHS